MPTTLRSSALAPASRSWTSAASLVVVLLLSLLFAGAIWAAGATKPVSDPTIAALQGGL